MHPFEIFQRAKEKAKREGEEEEEEECRLRDFQKFQEVSSPTDVLKTFFIYTTAEGNGGRFDDIANIISSFAGPSPSKPKRTKFAPPPRSIERPSSSRGRSRGKRRGGLTRKEETKRKTPSLEHPYSRGRGRGRGSRCKYVEIEREKKRKQIEIERNN